MLKLILFRCKHELFDKKASFGHEAACFGSNSGCPGIPEYLEAYRGTRLLVLDKEPWPTLNGFCIAWSKSLIENFAMAAYVGPN